MNTKNKLNAITVSGLLYGLFTSSAIQAKDYIAPAMINIPEGSFVMGTNSGDSAAKPSHIVAIEKFQLAKYPVTVAEFRKFVEDTNFEIEATCKDKLDKNWLSSPTTIGTARWDNNRYLKSEYQPVTCINYREASAYVSWLSEKTGEQYRLPTEPEFEYAARANTTSRYFWGDDPYETQACLYGNFADEAGEYFASTEHGASYVGFLEYANCNDGEPYIAITGLYRPNPFGLYDMAGNVSEILGQCYYSGHQARSNDEMDISQCESVSQRGSNWHYPAEPHYTRSSYAKEKWSASALIGFRVARDGHSDYVDASTKVFEADLKKAQVERLQSRPTIPSAPTSLQLKLDKNGDYILSWQPIQSKEVIGYEVYQSTTPYSHLLGGYFKDQYQLLTAVDANISTLSVSPIKSGQSYRILAKTKTQTSLPSSAVTTTQPQVMTIPGRVDMQQSTLLTGALLKLRKKTKEKDELYYISAFNHQHEQPRISTRFDVNVKKSGWYQVNYNGIVIIEEGKFFDIWLNDELVGQIDFHKDVNDKMSKRHKVYLDAGQHQLEFSFKSEGFEIWDLGWVDFTEASKD